MNTVEMSFVVKAVCQALGQKIVKRYELLGDIKDLSKREGDELARVLLNETDAKLGNLDNEIFALRRFLEAAESGEIEVTV